MRDDDFQLAADLASLIGALLAGELLTPHYTTVMNSALHSVEREALRRDRMRRAELEDEAASISGGAV